MARYEFRTTRLFVETDLAADALVPLDRQQTNYLTNVLRMSEGTPVLVFNGRDGEWLAGLRQQGRKVFALEIGEQQRAQPPAPDLHYLFAPLKQARLDYVVGKAVEMGVGRLRPVITQHTQVTKLNRNRAEANIIEAAEQCGVLAVPTINDPQPLNGLLDYWRQTDPERRIVFCDEGHPGDDAMTALTGLPPGPLAVLVGPEGGFSNAERDRLLGLPFVSPLPLGPRILRADTAAVAALALVQATVGDWSQRQDQSPSATTVAR
ncbi:16S rRNA (uracil(1498)-N(3))-methyltransferase [Bauldia sp.]|uniref:16S rRNA (uracil(1498)-N(3))-methyltransferase n=1 Tax=Bauldia sp. TaxID=2575872 RepID=UPI003BAA6098